MLVFDVLLIIVLGLIFGSFLTAFSYRTPRQISIAQGRSFCPRCKKQINWYDNIPVLSYLLLGGKCRFCQKKISLRYPLIELGTALMFLLFFSAVYSPAPENFVSGVFNLWNNSLGIFSLPFFLLIGWVLLLVFVIDLERQIIPDKLVFFLYSLVVSVLVLTHFTDFYNFLLAGYLGSLFLLLLVLITSGRGMGLGDVKLAIPLGTFLGLKYTVLWLLVAFLTGGLLGIILILSRRAKLQQKIAFGPFLIVAFFIVLLWGEKILNTWGVF